jgi:hypothetical protein
MSGNIKSSESPEKDDGNRHLRVPRPGMEAARPIAAPADGSPTTGKDQCCTADVAVAGEVIWMPVTHPLPWHSPLNPGAVRSGELKVIARGAVTAGATGDAVVACDYAEQARRRSAGLGAVTSPWLLDALMNLPVGAPVRVEDLSEDVWERVRAAPRGVAEIDGGWVTRLLSPPLTVVGAVVPGTGWRRPLQRAGLFTPFAQRLIVLSKVPPSRVAWEAEVAGIGVWVSGDGELTELFPPEPFTRRYWKPAGWRFAERAYAASLSASSPPEWSPA